MYISCIYIYLYIDVNKWFELLALHKLAADKNMTLLHRVKSYAAGGPALYTRGPLYWHGLTHLPLDKMAAIFADDIFKYIFLNENDRIPVQISLKFVPRSPIDKKPALVQVMAWRRIGDKPLPEPVMTQFTDTGMRH